MNTSGIKIIRKGRGLEHLNPQTARYWHRLADGRVQCELCPHFCRMAVGERGWCGQRENQDGELAALNYGQISSVALDPIEKKPLYRFKPNSKILSIGGLGCSLRCPFCQNSDISIDFEAAARHTQPLLPEDVRALVLRAKSQGNVGVAYTYNEPFIAYEYVHDCAKLIHEAGMCNVLVTNGYVNLEPLGALLPLVDAMNIDLKGFTDAFYRKLGGSLEVVKRTIEVASRSCHIEVTTLVIPGENEDDVVAIARWLAELDPDIPLHLSRFFPHYLYADRPPTSRELMRELADAARQFLNHVYLGNM